jgi:hypothetical protein
MYLLYQPLSQIGGGGVIEHIKKDYFLNQQRPLSSPDIQTFCINITYNEKFLDKTQSYLT